MSNQNEFQWPHINYNSLIKQQNSRTYQQYVDSILFDVLSSVCKENDKQMTYYEFDRLG